MKIHFCDLCNESVPQADLDQGRAFLRKGRVVCATCDRSMGREQQATGEAASKPPVAAEQARVPERATAAAPRPAPASGAGWLAAATLVFAVTATALLVERATRLEMELGALEGALAGLERRAEARVESQASALAARVGEGEARVDRRLGEELARVERALERVDARIEEAARRREADVTALEGARRELAELRRESSERAQALAARIERGEQDLAFHGKRLTDLEMAQLVRKTSPPEAAPVQAAWQQSLAGLKSPVAGTRWEAVDALGRSGDPAVVPHLVPHLKDADTFVRMATARVLGSLASQEGVEPLFDALQDAEAAVREAAWVSLLSLTGRDFRYDPLGPESERQKRLKAWLEWWRKEGARGAAGAVPVDGAG